ncbi:hypothetical protein WR25_08377 [Diploscapter pachys]|uniref:Uncharacterized protein n=1 Tax=Diploscapter pachys TaxID=2018661 RepID=A0A2A2M281_9BILA|nr:hypothetical protein WR25_08377 [Diploscapter pachys]
MADRIESVGQRQRVFVAIGQVDHGRSERRPETCELDAAGKAQFLAVLQILDFGEDIAVEPQIAGHDIGGARSDRRIHFVAAHGQPVLVEARSDRPVPLGRIVGRSDRR